MNGTIALICNMYVVLNQKIKINRNPLYNMLLPGDNVEYNIIDNMINITKITSRKTQYLLAIVKKIENNKAILFCPNYPKFFEPNIMNNNYKLNNMMIIEITLDSINVIIIYDSIKNRIHDKYIILMLYKLNATTDIKLEYNINNNNYITNNIIDLSHLDSFNVDPTNSKDFDDAISVDTSNNKIYVHIVDSHELININTNIDLYALCHSFTLYLPEHIENILPKKLAENELSLIKGMIRKVITIEYNISNDDYDIYKSNILIKERYDYNNFNYDKYPILIDFINKWKYNSLNIPHVVLSIDMNGKINSYKSETNFDMSHEIIETLMILTNLTISKHIQSINDEVIPQRYHSKIKNYNIIETNSPIDNILAIKKYKAALYDDMNTGHFGLGLNTYTHFTSPIRRYFDVIIHRLLAGVRIDNINEVLEYINGRERYIDKITKLYNMLKIFDYLDNNKNKIWNSYIIGKTDIGYTCLIEDLLYEIFIFSNNCYEIGDKINVKIKNVIWETLDIKANII